MDFKSYLTETAGEIEKVLDEFFTEFEGEVEGISPTLVPLVKKLREGCKGGKKLRGTLVRMGYQLSAISQQPLAREILKPAAGVEIFQTAILAHDDIIDESPLRRGKPTIYMQLGGDHYGISQTIALADIGFFLTVKLISSANFPPELKNKAISAFSQTVINTGLGEMLDVELPRIPGDRKDSDVMTIHRLKTAYYTIIDPLCLGATLAGADTKVLKAIAEFGEALGIAFQIQDDILGVFGTEATLGKSVTSDIEEGKNTLLITFAQEHANEEQKEILKECYGKPNISENDLERVRKVFIDCGALEYSKKEALGLVDKSKKVIPQITSDPKYQSLLSGMAEFLVERQA